MYLSIEFIEKIVFVKKVENILFPLTLTVIT